MRDGQGVHAANVAIIEGKESTFITLSYTFDQLVIVNFRHTPIVPNLLFLAIRWLKIIMVNRNPKPHRAT